MADDDARTVEAFASSDDPLHGANETSDP